MRKKISFYHQKAGLCFTAFLLMQLSAFWLLPSSLEANKKLKDNLVVDYQKKIGQEDVLEVRITLINESQKARIQTDHFNIVANPSYQSSITISGGKVIRKNSTVYLLKPRKKGSTTFSVMVGNVKAGSYLVEVLAGSIVPRAGGRQSPYVRNPLARFFSNDYKHLSTNDVLIKNVVSKKRVFVNEPILLETILYYRTQISTPRPIKLDNLQGFSSASLKLSANSNKPKSITIANLRYQSVVIEKRIIYGHYAGEFTLQGGTWFVKSRGNSFFNRDELKVKVPYIKMVVIEYPNHNKPANFQNAYGDFSLKVQVATNSTKLYEPLLVEIVLVGNGNFDSLILPDIKASLSVTNRRDEDIYIIKKKDTLANYQWNGNTYSGSKGTRYYIIPQKQSNFTLPLLTFSYYSQKNAKYVQLTATKKPIIINVLPNPNAPNPNASYVAQDGASIPPSNLKTNRTFSPIYTALSTDSLSTTSTQTNLLLTPISLSVHAIAVLLLCANAVAFVMRKKLHQMVWQFYPNSKIPLQTTEKVNGLKYKQLLYSRALFLIKKFRSIQNQEIFIKNLEMALKDYLFNFFAISSSTSLYELKKIIEQLTEYSVSQSVLASERNAFKQIGHVAFEIVKKIEAYQNFLYAPKQSLEQTQNIASLKKISIQEEIKANIKLLAKMNKNFQVVKNKIAYKN